MIALKYNEYLGGFFKYKINKNEYIKLEKRKPTSSNNTTKIIVINIGAIFTNLFFTAAIFNSSFSFKVFKLFKKYIANKRKPKLATSIGKLDGPTTSSPIVFSKPKDEIKYIINVIKNIDASIFCFEKNNLNISFINILP